jgi:perosamine synthetase
VFGLIPTEFHQYSLMDVVSALLSVHDSAVSRAETLLPGVGKCIPIRSARAALIVAIKALGLPPGSRIGVPLYCCPVVFKAIKSADCTPSFLDCAPETLCLSLEALQNKQPEIDALVAVHLFGNPCDMDEVLHLMSGKPVIEDCAQSIGSKIGAQTCGSFGDISFFSFRSGKYLSVAEGGALYSKHSNLLLDISKLAESLPGPTFSQEVRHVAKAYIRSKLRSRPWWGLLGNAVWAIYNKRTEFADKSPIVLGRIFESDKVILRKRLAQIDIKVSRQRAYSDYYTHNLRLEPGMLISERPKTYHNRFMYPIVFPSPEIRRIMAVHLKRHGIDTSQPYEDVITGAAKHYGYQGECPVTEQLLRRVLVIPVHFKLTLSDVQRITNQINEAWQKNIKP